MLQSPCIAPTCKEHWTESESFILHSVPGAPNLAWVSVGTGALGVTLLFGPLVAVVHADVMSLADRGQGRMGRWVRRTGMESCDFDALT